MPVTFLAHQAPVLPLKRWRPQLDGVALVAGTVVPDLARATQQGPAWYLAGQPLWFDGHRPSQIVSWCLVVGVLLTWSARRLVLPKLAGYLPDAGSFHLRDLRLVGRVRHRWWMVLSCVLVGVLTHVVLDLFTHTDRGIVLPGLRFHVATIAGRWITLAGVLQIAASVGLSVVAVWQLWEIGRRREMCAWHGVEVGPVPDPPRLWAVRAAVLVAGAVGVVVGSSQVHRGVTTGLMTGVIVCWVLLCVIASACPPLNSGRLAPTIGVK